MPTQDQPGVITGVVTPGRGRERDVARAFVELADTLIDDYDIIDLLDRLIAHSVRLLAADAAGIMLVDANSVLQVVASSSEDAELMELMQLQNDQGPCLDCYHTVAAVSVPISPRPPPGGHCSPQPSRNGAPSGRCTRCPCGCAAGRSGH